MEVQIAVINIKKYSASESGDALEVVKHPIDGLSIEKVTIARKAARVLLLIEP
jgi:hypothetical protein